MIEEKMDDIKLEMPKSEFTERALQNLRMILKNKRTLISHALGTDDIEFTEKEDRIVFPSFIGKINPDNIQAYSEFIRKLCNFAKTLKRVNDKLDVQVVNEKYAFRCFLIRLGFIGEEYKTERKILLRNLSGNAAFKNSKGEINDER